MHQFTTASVHVTCSGYIRPYIYSFTILVTKDIMFVYQQVAVFMLSHI